MITKFYKILFYCFSLETFLYIKKLSHDTIHFRLVMKTINKEVLKIAADKIMLELDDNQYDSLIVELKGICQLMDDIKNIPGIDSVEPMTFPFDNRTTYLREDVIEEPLSKEEVLKNAGDVKDGQIRLPKVVG